MKLVVLDPGYGDAHSHHQIVNSAIQSAFKTKNVDVIVFASHSLKINEVNKFKAKGFTIYPYFKTQCYLPTVDFLSQSEHDNLAKSFFLEIMNLYRDGRINGDEHILLHTGYSFHIAGIGRALWHLRHFLSGTFILSMMFYPGGGLSGISKQLEHSKARQFLRYKHALKLLTEIQINSNLDIIIATSCSLYQTAYQKLWSLGNVQIHPSIVYRPLTANIKLSNFNNSRVLLYLGGTKKDKGIVYALRLGIAAAKLFPNTRFIFHFNNQFPGASHFVALVDELEFAGEMNQNVKVIYGNLSPNCYDDLLLSIDIFCLLYNPEIYQFKTSGIFWDGLRCLDISWLVTKDTWAAAELESLGILFSTVLYGNVTDGLEKLGQLINNCGKNKKLAGEPAPAIDWQYFEKILYPYGEWLCKQLPIDAE